MKIVFIQPNVGFKGHTWEALGIGYMMSYIKKHYEGNLEMDFFSGFYDTDEAIIKGCKDADIVGFGCTSPQFKHATQLAARIKRPGNLMVFGGMHVTALPQEVLKHKNVDTIVAGEGEKSMLQVVKDFENGKVQRVYNPGFIENIDELPFPDREGIKNERNIQQAFEDTGERITSVFSSRGCPFNCSFCCSRILWGRNVRIRSPENVLDEVEELVKDWKIDFLKFSDDTFTINKQNTMDFCRMKIERGIDVPYGANAHVNTMDRELMGMLAKSGCRELWFGVESGSPRILKDMHKHSTIEKIKEIFKLAEEFGIKRRAYFILGLPNETIEDIKMTEKLCDELEPDTVGFTLLSPFPRNEYFDYEKMKDWDWSKFDEYSNDYVHTKTLSNEQLKAIQKRLVEKYGKNITFRQKQIERGQSNEE